MLSPASHTRSLNSVPYGSPARRQSWGLTTFLVHHMTELEPASPPVVFSMTCPVKAAEQPTTNACQQLWRFNAYDVY